ncbi:galactan 5-O-arabinofuranosyltransferase [Corynebacterium aquilae]|uniref:Galactan 5-O-arabinofuranosyltransferase n=1 Tax=Corynebacterium aquilae DSM 44791 TaxID=1431546 RepID=A0A1L7CDA8_9CORY|nr:galactan 5-O-arabinofuranosyltransferase [Corynebacterium aquilae]APT83804.1 membrane protein [Corynebacterium aquilae DSM 44791]
MPNRIKRDSETDSPQESHTANGFLPLAEEYTDDVWSAGRSLLGIFAAGFGGGLATLIAWLILRHTHMPAFGGSQLSRAVATGTTVLLILTVMWLVVAYLGGSIPRWRRWISYLVFYLSPAGLVVTTTAIPLAATRLYMDGVTVDQGFRSQFLTHMANTTALTDMNYIDMPSYYPAAWFWMGGRLANLLGIPGWEVFQPWALVSIAAVGCMLVPVWQRLCGSLPVATAVALVTTSVVLVMSSDEPYAAVIALGAPAATVLGRRALSGARLSMLGIILFLGISASMYTLFTAVVAMSVVAVAAATAVFVERSLAPIIRLIFIGVASGLIALIVWGPYLWAVLQGRPRSGASATHYLPPSGTQIPLPMFSLSMLGVLCLLGFIFLVVRSQDRDVRAMGISLIVFYAWVIASMIATLAGGTLLGFRLDVIIALQLATAGVFAIAEMRMVGFDYFYPHMISPRVSRAITFIMVSLLSLGGISYAQNIPNKNADAIDLAYTDTDGYGERADRYPADSGKFYPEINNYLTGLGFEPGSTVVLTDEQNFMSFYPYRGFQAFTSHYANPLGEFDKRNLAIENLAEASWDGAGAFNKGLEELDWQPPEVFIFRDFKYDLAEDLYPNNPNVRFRGIYFNPDAFEGWTEKQIGPFIVVTKKR